MEKYFKMLKSNPLFYNIPPEEYSSLLFALSAKGKKFYKSEYIINEGDPINSVGIVISGNILIEKNDYSGYRTIIGEARPSELFAEVFACSNIKTSPVSITAAEDSEILFINFNDFLRGNQNGNLYYNTIILNMLKIVSDKALYLNQRLDIISKRKMRDRILTYLNYISNGRTKFDIPLNREELAQFLSTDRSALSKELSKMQKDGLITYRKNKFELL